MIEKDSIIGIIGVGIAQTASKNEHQVYLYDAYAEQLPKAKAGLEKILNRQIEKGRMVQEEVDGILSHIHFTWKYSIYCCNGLLF